ncbi:MAG: glycosyltransferase family 39 protein [Candidatus Eisenbacteria bacterium]
MKRRARIPYLLGFLLAVLALLVRLYQLDWGFPDIYEEATSVQKAWGFWGWGGDSFDFNPHFFNYPSFYFYLQFAVQALVRAGGAISGALPDAAAFQAAYFLEPSLFVGAGRLLTALLGAASVFVLYAVGLRAGGKRVAVPAALFLAFHSLHVEKSRFVEVDVAVTFFVVLSYLFAARHAGGERPRSIFLAGASAGLAAATKYPGGFFLLNLPLAERLRVGPFRVRRVLVGLLAAAAVFFVASPYVLLDFASFLRDLGAEGVHMREGHFGGTGEGVAGAFDLFSLGFGRPLFLLSIAGLGAAALRPRGIERLFVPLPVLFFVLLSVSRMQAPHYVLPVVPPLALLASIFLDRALPAGVRGRRALHAAAVLLLLLSPALSTARTAARLGMRDTRTEAREWIEATVPFGAAVLLEPHGPNLRSSSEIRRYAESDEFAPIRRTLLARTAAEPWYRTAILPSFSIDVERGARFYRFEPYQWFEYIVLCEGIYGRYRSDPERFPLQRAFYEEVERRYRPVMRFASPAGAGPAIDVYRRDPAAPPRPEIRLDPAGAGDRVFIGFFRSVASLYRERGLLDEAALLCDAILELAPGDSETLLHRGILAGMRGDFPRGVLDLMNGVRADPGNRQIRMSLGVLLCQAGREEEGIALLREMVLEKEEAEVHGNLASALIQSGREREAIVHLRRFLEMAPDHARAPEVRALLESLGG